MNPDPVFSTSFPTAAPRKRERSARGRRTGDYLVAWGVGPRGRLAKNCPRLP